MADKAKHKVPQIPLTDYREGVDPRKSFTGKYPSNIINELIHGAKTRGLDPNLVLSMGLQESNLGAAAGSSGRSNPMMWNPPKTGKPTFPSDTLLGGLDDNATSPEARDSLDREYSIGKALDYLKAKLAKYPGNIEHAVQAFNGLGSPVELEGKSYGGIERQDLPENFYGKRVLDLKGNVIEKNPLLQQMIQRVK